MANAPPNAIIASEPNSFGGRKTNMSQQPSTTMADVYGGCIRFRNRDYFGIPVNLEMSKVGSGPCTFKVGVKTISKRSKNKNPFMTRFTVKNLKKLLEQQAAAAEADKLSAAAIGSGK